MDHANIGFIGCGTHSTNNLYPMLAYTRGRLDAVCDLNRELAERNARVFGGRSVYTDAAKMLDERKLDGVMIVGSPELHYEIGKQVLARSIPLFVEKPPAPTLAQTRELAALAQIKKTFLMTGFMKRHGLPYRKLRLMIAAGEFTPAAGLIKYGHWPLTDLNHMLLFMCIHPIDLALSIFGTAASVSSTLSKDARNAISLSVVLRFASGKWAQLMLDSSQPRVQERTEISGTHKGSNALFVVENVDHVEFHTSSHNGTDLNHDLNLIAPEVHLEGIQHWRPDYGIPNMQQTRHFTQGFAGEVREFVDAIIEKRSPYPAGEDAIAAMRVIDALLKNPDGSTELSR